MTLAPGSHFALRLESHGQAPALIDGDRIVSYAELARLADAFAAGLTSDVRLLAIEMASRVEPIAAYLGALRAGVPVLLHGGGASARAILAACPPDATYEFREGADEPWALELQPRPWPQPPNPELGVLLSTSGSTGSGKLVRLSRSNLQANAHSIRTYLGITAAERAVTSLPLSYSYGLSVLNSHLLAGACVVLTEASVSDPAFRKLVMDRQVTSIAGVPYSYELMERAGLLEALPESVRTLTQAGGRLDEGRIRKVADLAARTGRRFFVMYGQTEATARIAYVPWEELRDNIGCIGRAIPDGELWIEGDGGAPAQMGAEGEIVYRGPNVMMGYAGGRDDLAAPAGPDVLHTGDIGLEVRPGLFRVTGRKSRFVKLFGLRVSLDEIERRLAADGIAAAAAGDDTLVAIAAPDDAAARRARDLIVRMDLPVDSFEFVVGDPPRLDGGKLDYRSLLARARARREAAAAERGAMGEVEDHFRRLAGGRAPAPTDTFQTLGGDSLSYVQMSLEIESALGHLPEAWETMTLDELRALARPAQNRTWRISWLETDVLLRAASIVAVVAFHAGKSPSGGAYVVMMLAGFSWARFQQPRLLAGRGIDVFRDYALRYIPPYFFLILTYFALRGVIWWPHLLFINTFVHGHQELLGVYWFMETLTWCVGAVCAAFMLEPVRRFVAERPAAAALGFAVGALALRLLGAQVLDPARTLGRTPDQILFFFAIGWALAANRNRAVQAGLVLLVPFAYRTGSAITIPIAVAVAILLIAAAPRIPMPRPLGRAISRISAASFYIYLLHPVAIYVRDMVLHVPVSKIWPIEIAAGVSLGLAGHAVLGKVDLARVWSRRSQTARAAPETR